MKRLSLLSLLAFVILSYNINAQDVDAQDFDGANCTSIMVGKDASTDGSVMTSHTCDSKYRTWARWEKAQEYDKTNPDIYINLAMTYLNDIKDILRQFNMQIIEFTDELLFEFFELFCTIQIFILFPVIQFGQHLFHIFTYLLR